MRDSLCFILALCGACGTDLNYIETTASPHRLYSRRPGQVEVFMTGRPNRPFVEVGMIESQQEQLSLDDEQEVIAKMREYAGEQGCDALAIFAGNDTTVTTATSSTGTISRSLKGYRGSCIVYTGPQQVASLAQKSCIPNSTQLCYGPAGCRGGQSCTADGTAYTACDCGDRP
jgi:hypothetical protein